MNAKINKIIKKIEEYENIGIFHHINIDGDSFSSSYGLVLALREKYPNKKIYFIADPIQVTKGLKFVDVKKSLTKLTMPKNFLAIIGDTSSLKRIEHAEILEQAKEVICFDHHQNDADFKPSILWRKPTYPASSLQAIKIAEALKIKFNEEIAFNLLIGILTDTGFFAYSFANPEPPKYFAKLLEFVSDKKMSEFHKRMQEKTALDIEVSAFIFSKIKFFKNISYVYITEKDVQRFKDYDFKIKINTIGNIKNYPIWAFFTEDKNVENEKIIRINMRSNGPNVSKIAISHNGGGHIRAAGATIMRNKKTFELFLEELSKQMD